MKAPTARMVAKAIRGANRLKKTGFVRVPPPRRFPSSSSGPPATAAP
jgi:hypothetical protein